MEEATAAGKQDLAVSTAALEALEVAQPLVVEVEDASLFCSRCDKEFERPELKQDTTHCRPACTRSERPPHSRVHEVRSNDPSLQKVFAAA